MKTKDMNASTKRGRLLIGLNDTMLDIVVGLETFADNEDILPREPPELKRFRTRMWELAEDYIDAVTKYLTP